MSYTYETEDQVKDAARSIEQREYWETVKSLAKDSFESSDDESEQDDHAWQSVDGCWHIIYTVGNFEVLRHTSNDDAWQEYGPLDPSKALAQMAFSSMLADVREAMQELRDAREASEDEE